MEGGEIHDLPGCNSRGLAITWLGERGFKRHSCLALAHNSGANHAGVCKTRAHTHTQHQGKQEGDKKKNALIKVKKDKDINNKSGEGERVLLFGNQQLYKIKFHLYTPECICIESGHARTCNNYLLDCNSCSCLIGNY